MLSVIPEDIWAQALSIAVRVTSSRVLPEAVLQATLPWNSMQTSQLNLAGLSVE
jgi:hypothetical protein